MSKFIYVFCFLFSCFLGGCSNRLAYRHVVHIHNNCNFSVDVKLFRHSNYFKDGEFVVNPGGFGRIFSYRTGFSSIGRAFPGDYYLEVRGNGTVAVFDGNSIISRLVADEVDGDGFWLVEFDDFCRK